MNPLLLKARPDMVLIFVRFKEFDLITCNNLSTGSQILLSDKREARLKWGQKNSN